MIEVIIIAVLFLIALIWGEKQVKKNILVSNLPDGVARWENEIREVSKRTGVPAEIIAAVIWQESGGNPGAVGSAGERGLMQLKGGAVSDVKTTFPKVADEVRLYGEIPYSNILAGAYYLKIQRENHSNWDQALEAYNQGARGRTMEGRDKLAAEYRSKVNEKINRIT